MMKKNTKATLQASSQEIKENERRARLIELLEQLDSVVTEFHDTWWAVNEFTSDAICPDSDSSIPDWGDFYADVSEWRAASVKNLRDLMSGDYADLECNDAQRGFAVKHEIPGPTWGDTLKE